jgi:hypothetical protein
MSRALLFPGSLVAGLCGLMTIGAAVGAERTGPAEEKPPERWIGVHLLAPAPDALPLLKRAVTEARSLRRWRPWA